ncbi:IS110 family transposase [Streptomyces sp. NPDC086082]|uniref:IS110 family transposase n=1 Tax=Streptomyces sp. NPDC086082 TaxID=3365750 RepID=UPI00382001E8
MGVFLGLDVGKTTHHGHGLTPAGKKVFDRPLPNSEPKLRAVFEKLATKFDTVLFVVDQPASIAALPLAVAQDAGCKIAYLPGLAMRRIADLYLGRAKTDAKDAAVIADAARTQLCPGTRVRPEQRQDPQAVTRVAGKSSYAQLTPVWATAKRVLEHVPWKAAAWPGAEDGEVADGKRRRGSPRAPFALNDGTSAAAPPPRNRLSARPDLLARRPGLSHPLLISSCCGAWTRGRRGDVGLPATPQPA